ncbi:MAG: glycoside hydrolase family 32 protein [Clostridiales bacterium]|nr:glycoside hydrolase family 32 protein [Clostridiales bacterium]
MSRDFRPLRHYTPPFGWINDPNGLVYEDGTWHLFAQHNPEATHWGPMHWRHAVSCDLLSWEDRGIALFPDEALGMIFSGSAVIDHGNTSGLGDGADPMILMYTSHGEHEQQSIAYSNDRVTFTPYAGDPVIPNTVQKNFRDPKCFWDAERGRWCVVIAAGDRVEFHASPDLIRWQKTGEFGQCENRMGGVFECPDLFPLPAPDGSTVWVLIASMAHPGPFGGHRTQYFLGQFDGETFRETMPAPHARLLDAGYDDYAAVTFANADRPMLLGWANAWCYAMFEPTDPFCGAMTYARALSLVETDAGLCLAQKPVTPAFRDVPVPTEPAPDPLPRRYLPKAEGVVRGEVFHIRVESEGCFALTLSNEGGESLCVTLGTDQSLVVDRSRAGNSDFSPLYASGLFAVMAQPRKVHGPATLDLYFDRMICETFLDGGTLVNTSVVFPEAPYTKATLLGEGRLYIGEEAQ